MVRMHVKYVHVKWACPTLILVLIQAPILWCVTHAHLESKDVDFNLKNQPLVFKKNCHLSFLYVAMHVFGYVIFVHLWTFKNVKSK